MATCAFAIIHNKNKILLVRIAPPFAEAHKCNFPGGVIEDGEDIQNGLMREVAEETHVTCRVEKIRDMFTTDNPSNEISIFEAVYETGDIVIQEEEIIEAGWFTLPEALELPLAFNIRSYLEDLESR